jgi:hypothetical protein
VALPARVSCRWVGPAGSTVLWALGLDPTTLSRNDVDKLYTVPSAPAGAATVLRPVRDLLHALLPTRAPHYRELPPGPVPGGTR